MAPSDPPRPQKPRAATPAERGAEFAEAQRKLKAEAAARREAARDVPRPARPSARRGRA